MRRLRVLRKADTIDDIDLRIETFDALPRGRDDVLVAVRAAGVNRSDVSAALGRMPQAAWPRTPGRDWAGVVVEGPGELVGQEVFGAGGDLGITRDGTHGSHLVVHRDAVVAKPAALSLAEAGALGVPFVTALEGFHRAGMPKPGDVVLVMAANGMVGQAAVQIAEMLGARVFGVTRRAEAFAHEGCAVRMIDASSADVVAVVRSETGGHGADIVYNTVGSPYFAAANQAMAHGGRQILISTVERSGAVRHLRVLSWPAHVRWHRLAGAGCVRIGWPAARVAARFCERPAQAVPGGAERLLSAGAGDGRVSGGAGNRSGSGRAAAVTEERRVHTKNTERPQRTTEKRLARIARRALRFFSVALCAPSVFSVWNLPFRRRSCIPWRW